LVTLEVNDPSGELKIKSILELRDVYRQQRDWLAFGDLPGGPTRKFVIHLTIRMERLPRDIQTDEDIARFIETSLRG
jgi:hypothetical protein